MLALVSLALAQEPVALPPLLPPPTLAQQQNAKGKGKRKKKKYPYWDHDPFITPGGGIQVVGANGNTTTAVTVGGQAGVDSVYMQSKAWPRVGGTSRLGVTYLATDTSNGNSEGLDVRAGSFWGPRWQKASVQIGPDLFYNQWSYGQDKLDPTYGVELPVTAELSLFGTPGLRLWGGVAPAWVSEESRRVDWQNSDATLPGIGHEFTYMAGASGVLQGVSINANYQYRITALGPQQTVFVGAQVSGGNLWDLVEAAQDAQNGGNNNNGGDNNGSGTDDDGAGKR
jgi:hypothetical protein